MELTSISQKVTVHIKEGEPQAISIYNGQPKMYMIIPFDQKMHDDFFEVNSVKENHENA